jgi:hypothetical protein
MTLRYRCYQFATPTRYLCVPRCTLPLLAENESYGGTPTSVVASNGTTCGPSSNSWLAMDPSTAYATGDESSPERKETTSILLCQSEIQTTLIVNAYPSP